MNITDYLTEQNIFYASFIVMGVISLSTAMWARSLDKRKKVLERANEILSDQMRQADIDKEGDRIIYDEIDKLLAFKNKQLDEKDRQLTNLLKSCDTEQRAWQQVQMNDIEHMNRLKAILLRVYPYSRLIINDAEKLDKWLENLRKGKKAKAK